ncbi:S8 family serine peptidase [Cupriavidus sp. EM10]|uniref:S8 family serine peptidase n=1 Tax=Cupriavidus sp. EM10 TaxID=2839983 RepID=UPI001C00699D|nr:S8 family serine peptidase [Cupriavidus sp. EM10]QWE98160.1 S8 family serine peptidase [Cupriavidus sp. EM10]
MLELSEEQAATFERANPKINLYPVRTYRIAAVDIDSVMMAGGSFPFASSAKQAATPFKVKVVDGAGHAIAGVKIVVREWEVDEPVEAKTDEHGVATVPSQNGLAEYVLAVPFAGYWAKAQRGVLASQGVVSFVLDNLDPTHDDCRKHHYPTTPPQNAHSASVKVAVIDTGIDSHCDLSNVVCRTSHAQADDEDDIYDNGTGHGTHVAGIIGGNGVIRGIAPNASLMSYRVFERGARETVTFNIYTALSAAVRDGADIINLSLGQGETDRVLALAIQDAEAQGVLVVAASGNDGHDKPTYPASYAEVVSVAAVGRVGTFPADSLHGCNVQRVKGTDSQDFVPGFSNHGKVELAAPGVAVVSTIGIEGYAALDGTSMACPVVSGFAAALLENAPELKGASVPLSG